MSTSKRSQGIPACCVLLFAATAGATILTNGGFENGTVGHNQLPQGFGYWTGHDRAEVVGSENGIVPFEGTHMLRFITTGGIGDSQSTTCNINQAVDLSPWKSLIETGQAELIVSGWFNRIHVDDQTDTLFGINVSAYDGTIEDLETEIFNPPFIQQVWIETDRATETWELVGKRFPLPAWTDFVNIQIMAHENVYNDISGAGEFDGHYADMITMEIIPEPASLLLILGGMSLLRLRSGSKRGF